MRLIPVKPDQVQASWGHFEQWFYDAAEATDGRETFQTVLKSILTGATQLWVVMDGAEIIAIFGTTISDYPSGLKALLINYVVGKDISKWIDAFGEIEEYAKTYGCQRVEALGRKGWMKRMPDYTATRVLFKKEL